MLCILCESAPAELRGLCKADYHAAYRRGDLDKVALPARHGASAAMERTAARAVGTLKGRSDGYADVWVGDRWRLEHRVVMERVLGRELFPGENVHHIDGDKRNNDPDNLELWFRPQPGGQRVDQILDYVVAMHRDALMARLKD